MLPTPIALIVLLAGWLARGEGMLKVLMLGCLFGAAAAVALPALGGAPITPAVMLLPFLVWRALQEQGVQGMARQLAFPGVGFWLLLLVLWGVASAWFLPRLFAGETLVRAADRASMQGVKLLVLQPLATNFTQSAYLLGGLAAFVSVRCLLQAPGRMAAFRDAVLLVAMVNIGAALLNLLEIYLGLPSLLGLVRNAGYAVMVGGSVGGLQRISGTFAESSAFSTFTLPLFAFVASLWHDGVARPRSGRVALALLCLLLLSTSSTAYAGLAAYAALLGGAAVVRTMTGPNPVRIGPVAAALWAAAVAACVIVLLRPGTFDAVVQFFEVALVRKLESSSGLERSSWNLQAWTNFIDSNGVGIGLGSARASSFALVLLSNLGVAGAVLFAAFVVQLFRMPPASATPPAADLAVVRAARRAVLAVLIAASASATVFDLGIAFYAYAAAGTLVPLARTVPRRLDEPRPAKA